MKKTFYFLPLFLILFHSTLNFGQAFSKGADVSWLPQMEATGYQFYEGVMHSHARLTYTKVGEILTGEGDTRAALREEYKTVVPQLELLHKLYECLRAARDERGAIDFETVETRIQFNEERKIERIVPIKRNDAHKLIEECMLCANVCAATFIEKHNRGGYVQR